MRNRSLSLSHVMAARQILVEWSQFHSFKLAVTISRIGRSSCAESTCQQPHHWSKIRVMSLSRTSDVELVGSTVEGVVRVRNLAFEKWIAVRFTLDKWQTTSEVTARYKESLPNGTVDTFVFTIKLEDVLSRAEEKSLYLAVGNSVAGRENWTITVVETTTSRSCARRC